MIRSKLIMASLLLCTLISPAMSCKSQKSGGKANQEAYAKKIDKQPIKLAAISRGACFGSCPIYSLEVQSDGWVRYNGTQNVKHLGIYEKKYGLEIISRLFDKINALPLNTYKSNYDTYGSDLPRLSLRIVDKSDKTQSFAGLAFGPEELINLLEEFDKTFHVDDTWKKLQELPE